MRSPTSFPGDAKSSLAGAKSSLGDVKRTLGDLAGGGGASQITLFSTLNIMMVVGTGAHEELEGQVQALMHTGLVLAPGNKRSRRSTVADANAEAKLEPSIKACAAVADEKVRAERIREQGDEKELGWNPSS